jgi:hypothetical protein
MRIHKAIPHHTQRTTHDARYITGPAEPDPPRLPRLPVYFYILNGRLVCFLRRRIPRRVSSRRGACTCRECGGPPRGPKLTEPSRKSRAPPPTCPFCFLTLFVDISRVPAVESRRRWGNNSFPYNPQPKEDWPTISRNTSVSMGSRSPSNMPPDFMNDEAFGLFMEEPNVSNGFPQ